MRTTIFRIRSGKGPQACILPIAMLWCSVASAQLVQPYHRHFSVPEGLPTVTVSDITEDRDGYLWLATGSGLSRFDGVEFHNLRHRPGDPRSIPDEFMNTIALGKDGLLYAGGNKPQLCIVDPRADTLANISIPGVDADNIMGAMISDIHCDRKGRIWIAHGFRKLTVYDPRTKSFATQDVAPERGSSIRCDIIMKIIEDEDGSLWLGTMFGLVHFSPHSSPMEGNAGVVERLTHPERNAVDPDYEPVDHITSLIDLGDSLLISTMDQGVYIHQKATGAFRWVWRGSDQDPITSDRVVQDMVLSPNNTVLLVGSKLGVRSLSLRSGEVLAYDRDLDQNRIHQHVPLFPNAQRIHRDRRNNVWCGSGTNGLLLIPSRGEHFQNVFLDPAAADRNEALTLFKVVRDPYSGDTYALTVSGQGMYVVTPGRSSVRNHLPDGVESLIIGDIEFIDARTSYVSSGKGLYRFDRTTGTFTRPTSSASGSELLKAKVNRLSVDHHGRIWLARGSMEPLRYDPSDGSVIGLYTIAPDAARFITGHVSYVDVDPEGRLWLAGHNNMPFIVHPDGSCVALPIRDEGEPLPSLFYYAGVTFTPDGSAWIGSLHEGVMRFTFDGDVPIRSEIITTADGLSTDQVTRIASDRYDRIWIATLNGLNRLDPRDRTVRTYDIGDGLARMDLIRGMTVSDSGRFLVVGSDHGYSFMDLTIDPDVQAPPIVRVRSMAVFGQEVPVPNDQEEPDAVHLKHQQHQITFQIRSDDLAHANEVVYSYRLADLDTSWTDVGSEERIAMAHLPPGDHLFEARARRGDGPWGPVSQVRFVIAPPYWGTWWFRILIILLAASAIFLLFRWRLTKKTRAIELRFAREQALSEERLRIANDLHDELGSGLSVIKVKSQLALERPGSNPATEVLEQVASSSSELIDSMRQIIWTIRSGQSGLLDLLAYVRSYATGYLDDHGVACAFEVDDALKDRELNVEQRRALLLILKEALHNVVKHAKASRVIISVNCDEKLQFSIVDDGVGMNAPHEVGPAHGVGLQSMERRARSIGGELLIRSGNGTTVSVVVPLPPERTGPKVPLEPDPRTNTFA